MTPDELIEALHLANCVVDGACSEGRCGIAALIQHAMPQEPPGESSGVAQQHPWFCYCQTATECPNRQAEHFPAEEPAKEERCKCEYESGVRYSTDCPKHGAKGER